VVYRPFEAKRLSFHQDIVVFHIRPGPAGCHPLEDGLTLREMPLDDMPQVSRIDHLAFEPIWRLSAQDMKHAYRKSSYRTVMELDGEIIAYQMSSSTGFYAHLARLAVHPSVQRRRIGFRLVQDLLDYFMAAAQLLGGHAQHAARQHRLAGAVSTPSVSAKPANAFQSSFTRSKNKICSRPGITRAKRPYFILGKAGPVNAQQRQHRHQ
jgi:GNAT superfamily N-acetyltransferase